MKINEKDLLKEYGFHDWPYMEIVLYESSLIRSPQQKHLLDWTLAEKICLLELYTDPESDLQWEDRSEVLKQEFEGRPPDFFNISNIQRELHRIFSKPYPEHHICGMPVHPRGKEAAEFWLKYFRKDFVFQIESMLLNIEPFDYSDTIQTLDLAPPTKQLMKLRENNQLDKMMTMPSCKEWLMDPQIIEFYRSHLELHPGELEDENIPPSGQSITGQNLQQQQSDPHQPQSSGISSINAAQQQQSTSSQPPSNQSASVPPPPVGGNPLQNGTLVIENVATPPPNSHAHQQQQYPSGQQINIHLHQASSNTMAFGMMPPPSSTAGPMPPQQPQQYAHPQQQAHLFGVPRPSHYSYWAPQPPQQPLPNSTKWASYPPGPPQMLHPYPPPNGYWPPPTAHYGHPQMHPPPQGYWPPPTSPHYGHPQQYRPAMNGPIGGAQQPWMNGPHNYSETSGATRKKINRAKYNRFI